MATEEEIFLLNAKVQGDADVRRLGSAVALAEERFDQLYATLGKSDSATRAAASHFLDLKQQLLAARLEADALGDKLDRVSGKLAGVARAGAMSRAGLLGANMAQDVIQGGNPAFAINNILGAANDQGIKSLAGEFVAAAGGAKVLIGGLATLAITATAAFAVIDEGLKSDKLGWSDLGSVVDEMAGGAFSHAKGAIGETLGALHDFAAGIISTVADATIGWSDATSAVRTHKEEIERATRATLDYEKAAKAISGVKSDKQKADEDFGKKFGEEAAAMDPKGLKGLIDRMARAQEGQHADEMVDVETNEIGKDGKPTGNTIKSQKSRAALAAEAITQDFAKAIEGDKGFQQGIQQRLSRMGEDGSNLGGRRDDKKAKEEAEAREAERVNAGLDQADAAKAADAKSYKEQVDADKKAQQDDLDELYNKSVREGAEKERLAKAANKEDDRRGRVGDAFEQYNGRVSDIYQAARQVSPSRVIDSAGLADSIQSGVGGKDPAIETVNQLKEANQNLMKILQKPENQVARAG